MNILIFGASGMLGNALFKLFSDDVGIKTYGTVRSNSVKNEFRKDFHGRLLSNVHVDDWQRVCSLFDIIKPDVVINCVGIIKQLTESHDPLMTIPINSILPHYLSKLCLARNARLIHFSTDCVFSGSKGGYVEGDFADAGDLYGRSKYLGEVDYPGCVTLRTSIIGHELDGANSLINWFLSQNTSVKGYTKAIFSGLPTTEMAKVIRDYVIPNPSLRGVYHVSGNPISKYDLLQLVANVYGKQTDIIPDDSLSLDRSLKSGKFFETTGYRVKPWPQLIKELNEFWRSN
jgi:dTDP-4-dehydrorhamnose reductase